MVNDNLITLIHRFLLDDMGPDEKAKFEMEMASNDTIKKQLKMEQKFLEGMEYVADAAVSYTHLTLPTIYSV